MTMSEQRERLVAGASSVILGGLVLAYGAFSPWSQGSDGSSDGFSEFARPLGNGGAGTRAGVGPGWLAMAVVLVGLAVTLLVLGHRWLVIAGIVIAGGITALLVSVASGQVDDERAWLPEIERGSGLTMGWVAVVLVALGVLSAAVGWPRVPTGPRYRRRP